MNTKVVLIVTTVNWNDGCFFTVTSDPDKWQPPQAMLVDGQPIDLARELFELSVDLHKNWADIKIVSAVVNEGELNLVYCCSAPLDSNWKHPIMEVTAVDMQHDLHSQLVSAVRTF